MRVNVNGDGFNGVYTAQPCTDGWMFVKNDGTFLTTGIGVATCSGQTIKIGTASPLTRGTPEEMIAAVLAARPRVKITEVKEEDE